MAKRPTRAVATAAAEALAAMATAPTEQPPMAVFTDIGGGGGGGGQIVFCALGALGLSPVNERTVVDLADIVDLANDIRQRGLLQNLLVYPSPLIPGMDLVAGGGRRWRALNLLADRHELPEELVRHGIPCKRVADEKTALVVTVVENMRRVDVHFLDRAAAFARLRDDLGLSNRQIGELVIMSNDGVGQYLRIHDRLPHDLRAAAWRGELNFKQARELVAEKRSPLDEADSEGTLPDLLYGGVIIRTSYNTGPYMVEKITRVSDTYSVTCRYLSADGTPRRGANGIAYLNGLRLDDDGVIRKVNGETITILTMDQAMEMLAGQHRPPPAAYEQPEPRQTILDGEDDEDGHYSPPPAEPPMGTEKSRGCDRAQQRMPVSGEMPFPAGMLAYLGCASEGGRGLTKIWLVDRHTGRRFVAVPEQRDIEDEAQADG